MGADALRANQENVRLKRSCSLNLKHVLKRGKGFFFRLFKASVVYLDRGYLNTFCLVDRYSISYLLCAYCNCVQLLPNNIIKFANREVDLRTGVLRYPRAFLVFLKYPIVFQALILLYFNSFKVQLPVKKILLHFSVSIQLAVPADIVLF